jgi:co-chaperonin GroES (HSP10)
MVGHDDELYWINVGDQVIFPAMAGNEITVPEPTAERPRHQQRYIMIQERDVIAKIEATEPVDNVTVEPRQYVSS